MTTINSPIADRPLQKEYHLYVLFLAIAFRLVLLFVLPLSTDHIIDSYDRIAINVIEGKGFSYNGIGPTVARAPAYPLFLSAIFYVFGYNPEPFLIIRLISILLSALTAVVVFWLSSLWFSNLSRASVMSVGLIYALNPFEAWYTLKITADVLYVFFFTVYLGLLCQAFLVRKSGMIRTILVGLTGGILLLNKSIFLPLLVLIPISLLAIFPDLRNKGFILRSLLSFFVSLSVLFPWTLRNTKVANETVLVQTLAGYNFWFDFSLDRNRDSAIASGDMDRSFRGDDVLLDNGSVYAPYSLNADEDAAYDSQLTNEAVEWIRNNPRQFLLKVFDNLLSFWYMVETPKKMIIAALFSLFFIFASLGGAVVNFSSGHQRETLFFSFLVFSVNLIYSPIIAEFRYSLVVYPIMSLLAGPFLCFLGRSLGRLTRRQRYIDVQQS